MFIALALGFQIVILRSIFHELRKTNEERRNLSSSHRSVSPKKHCTSNDVYGPLMTVTSCKVFEQSIPLERLNLYTLAN